MAAKKPDVAPRKEVETGGGEASKVNAKNNGSKDTVASTSKETPPPAPNCVDKPDIKVTDPCTCDVHEELRKSFKSNCGTQNPGVFDDCDCDFHNDYRRKYSIKNTKSFKKQPWQEVETTPSAPVQGIKISLPAPSTQKTQKPTLAQVLNGYRPCKLGKKDF